jgi:hypothetical protein
MEKNFKMVLVFSNLVFALLVFLFIAMHSVSFGNQADAAVTSHASALVCIRS